METLRVRGRASVALPRRGIMEAIVLFFFLLGVVFFVLPIVALVKASGAAQAARRLEYRINEAEGRLDAAQREIERFKRALEVRPGVSAEERPIEPQRPADASAPEAAESALPALAGHAAS